jgi:hypothetical protein
MPPVLRLFKEEDQVPRIIIIIIIIIPDRVASLSCGPDKKKLKYDSLTMQQLAGSALLLIRRG